MRKGRFPSAGLVVLWLMAATGWGQPPQDTEANPFSMDLDSLFNTKVITASKFPEQMLDAPSVMSVVTSDELRRFGGLTLSEILGRVAGLTRSSAYFTDRSMISVRGDQARGNGGHVLILINGRPVREVLEGGVGSDLLESFPVDLLERIEVVRGPGSVLYGSDAFAGVINLITRKAEGTEVYARGANGPSGMAAGSEEIFFKQGDFNIVEGAQYHQLPRWDVLYRSFSGPGLPPAAQNATLRNEGSGGYLGINYKGFSFMSSYTALEMPSFVGGEVGDVRWKRGFADFGYALKAADKWDMNFNLTYTRSVLDSPDAPFIHRDSHETVLEWTNFITFSERDRLTFGTLYERQQGEEIYFGVTPAMIIGHGDRPAAGFYVQHEHRLTDDLKLIGGMQANKIGSLALNMVPRAGIVWNPMAHVTLKALYGGAFRAPSLNETSVNHPDLKGNPNLTPEQAGTLDVQLSYQNNRLQASAGYFHTRETSLIVADAGNIPVHYLNLGVPLTYQGVEAEAKYYFRRNWFVLASLLCESHHDIPLTVDLTTIPPIGAKAGVSYQSESGADVSLFDSYEGHVTGYGGSLNPRPDAFQWLTARFRFDLSKRWLKSDSTGVALFVHGTNLTNHPVWLPALGTSYQDTMPVNQGRTVLFGLEFWKKRE